MLERKIQGNSMLFYRDGQLILTIDEAETDGGILMTLKGDLISDTAHPIQDELGAFTTTGIAGIKVTIDFKEVAFAAPSVLNVLLDSQKLIDDSGKGALILKNIPDTIYQEMDDTGITELLMIEE